MRSPMFDSTPEPLRFPPVAGLTARAAFDGGNVVGLLARSANRLPSLQFIERFPV